ncbi:MAG: patatin-like phospholipase family protein [Gemmatimonadota bacterium]
MLKWTLLLLPLVGAGLAFRGQRRFYVTQYLFFIRFQILEALALAAFPLVAPRAAPEMLANLFVVEPIGMVVATMVGTLCAWSIVYTARLTWRSTPFRAGLPFRRVGSEDANEHAPRPSAREQGEREFADARWSPERWGWLLASLLLVLPLFVQLIRESDAGVGALTVAGLGGVLLAALIRQLSLRRSDRPARMLRWLGAHLERLPLLGRLIHVVAAAYRDAPAAHAETYRSLHERAFLFGATAGATYVGIGLTSLGIGTDWVPALVYVLAWFLVVVWILGFLAFQFDKTRIPGVPLAAAGVLIWQGLIPSHYEYRVLEQPLPDVDATEALHARQHASGSMVLFAAHGGGIKASLWTAQVAQGLESEIPGFSDRVGLVSGVSGGAVGATYYVDAFEPGAIDSVRLAGVRDAAATSSLAATTWGLVYLDFLRLAVGSGLNPRDRGWALERRWAEHLQSGERTLGEWTEGVRAGWRPVMIYNVTLQETGSRLLLAPVRVSPDLRGTRRDLFQYLPGRDLRVVTAARLSATFPWVSPQSRPALGADTLIPRLHSADGGYFDNSGVLSALEVAGRWLATDTARGVTRVALVEAQASGARVAVEQATADRGDLVNALIGPIRTLYNVRTTSQLARRESDAGLVARLWQDAYGVELCRFVFALTEGLPLSWHLTAQERRRIEAHWPASADTLAPTDTSTARVRAENRAQIEALRSYLTGEPCPASDTTGDGGG